MALMKGCSYAGCRTNVPYGQLYCDEHEVTVVADKKESYRQYAYGRTDKKELAFYKSTAWIALRELCLVHYDGLDLYQYYVNGEIIPANTVHHCIEVKDFGGWDNRLTFANLFPCSTATHNTIHAMYKADKQGTQKMLLDLIVRHEQE